MWGLQQRRHLNPGPRMSATLRSNSLKQMSWAHRQSWRWVTSGARKRQRSRIGLRVGWRIASRQTRICRRSITTMKPGGRGQWKPREVSYSLQTESQASWTRSSESTQYWARRVRIASEGKRQSRRWSRALSRHPTLAAASRHMEVERRDRQDIARPVALGACLWRARHTAMERPSLSSSAREIRAVR